MSDIKTYLETVCAFQRDSGNEGQRANAHRSQHAFILEHGRSMTYGRTRIYGPVKQCYANAFRLSMDDPSMTYCEGYTETHGIPIEHAWCIDKDGKVVETTIREKEPREYFGVPIKPDHLRRTIIEKETHQFFDWMHPESWVGVDATKIVEGLVWSDQNSPVEATLPHKLPKRRKAKENA